MALMKEYDAGGARKEGLKRGANNAIGTNESRVSL